MLKEKSKLDPNQGVNGGSDDSGMNKTKRQKDFTPALKLPLLTPVYDLSIRLFTREHIWREKLIGMADPKPHMRILDIGCGTGTLAIMFKKRFPECEVVGIDPDDRVLDIARKKAKRQGVTIDWIQGFVDGNSVSQLGSFSRIVSSLVLHQTSLEVKRSILKTAKLILEPGGRLCIADYGIQPNWMMKWMYRLIVQTIDGKADTQPNADGFILDCLNEIGFENVRQESEVFTITGSISLIEAIQSSVGHPKTSTESEAFENRR